MFMRTGIGPQLAQAMSRIRRGRRPTKTQQALIAEYLKDIQDRAADFDIQDRAADFGSDEGSDHLAAQAGGRA